jgi:hypothetical protein
VPHNDPSRRQIASTGLKNALWLLALHGFAEQTRTDALEAMMRLWHWIVGIFRGKAADGTAADMPIDTTNEWRNARHDEEVKQRLNVMDAGVNPHNMP